MTGKQRETVAEQAEVVASARSHEGEVAVTIE
jgi:hypothetical protein